MNHVQIKEVAIYHPKKSVSNDYYLNHFQKNKGKSIENFLKVMGRKQRYVIDNDHENAKTMAIEAAKRVLQKANLTGKDVQMIVFSTQTPETIFPTNAIFVHHAIEAGPATITLDSNANCAGMTVDIDQASRYMLSSPDVKRALVVGSDYNSLLSNPNDEITYTNYGDAASAVILEKTEENTGFIDAVYHSDSSQRDFILYLASGLSKTVKGEGQGKSIQWAQFDGSKCLPPAYDLIAKLLERNNLTVQDINLYSFSQFALVNIEKIQEHFSIRKEQIIYVGDRFGYTGTSSPFIALNEAVEMKQVKRGDYVLFWTIGAGYEQIAMLFKY
jgi:3-oxoacyl-[acyl-carrier-protein] synthase-3